MAKLLDIPSLDGWTASPETLMLVGAVDEFKGRWQALGAQTRDRLTALRRVATIESVASSTRIEGSKLSDAEVDQLLKGLDVGSFRSRDEEEVAGYAAAMNLIFESFAEMDCTENVIRQIHQTLLQHATKDQRHRGSYKTIPNDVKAFRDGVVVGVVFETATPFDTPRLMRELVDWTRGALATRSHHPLIVIGTFVVRFLAIHPFHDGNGRLSRTLTTLLLLRAGYAYVPYSSMERVVEDNKDRYYLALQHAQTDGSRLDEWLVFFLSTMRKQQEALQARLREHAIASPRPELQERLLQLASSLGKLTIGAAINATGAKRSTLKLHFKALVGDGALIAHGVGKGTWYERAVPRAQGVMPGL